MSYHRLDLPSGFSSHIPLLAEGRPQEGFVHSLVPCGSLLPLLEGKLSVTCLCPPKTSGGCPSVLLLPELSLHPSTGLHPKQSRGHQSSSLGLDACLPEHTSIPATPTVIEHLPLVPTGKYQEADTHLQEALHLTPSSEAAQARRGLLQLKKGDVSAAAHDLQCLAEKDTQDLGFLLRLLDSPERQSLVQVCISPQALC